MLDYGPFCAPLLHRELDHGAWVPQDVPCQFREGHGRHRGAINSQQEVPHRDTPRKVRRPSWDEALHAERKLLFPLSLGF
eukprot:CAMPEP_0180173640 /NCGR_PEP_ID=MMETSP0986-20121125/35692_1 /TAXON_ID=697907 /ORGANISM="non described non described, Strain CCMP2293" /LENGTH=79 /DNA_ID=CAMNT_0022125859 /DNA_START=382 /DNA_END=621 /DNA_ORIENTATION=-